MVVQTLRAMALGGMRDHIGGGFHRYSVDGNWRVPHFEKMLYDQAQLVLAYLEAAQAGGRSVLRADRRRHAAVRAPRHDRRERRLLFGRRCRQRAARASARQASPQSSSIAHKDGRRLLRLDRRRSPRRARRRQRRSSRRATACCRTATRRSIRSSEFVNKNLLYTAQSIADIARSAGQDAGRRGRVAAAIARRSCSTRASAAAAAARRQGADGVERPDDRRVRARRARARRRRCSARTTARIRSRRRTCAARRRPRRSSATRCGIRRRAALLRRYRAGDAAIDGYAEDYAYLIFGAARAVPGDRRCRSGSSGRASCRRGRTSCSGMPRAAAGSARPAHDPSVLLRMKEDYDGAEPSPTSVSAMNLLTLAHLTGERAYADRAGAGDRRRSAAASKSMGRAVPFMAAALSTSLAAGEQIVIVGHARRAPTPARCGSPPTRRTGRSR